MGLGSAAPEGRCSGQPLREKDEHLLMSGFYNFFFLLNFLEGAQHAQHSH
jgi:hypothetical protein